MPTTSPSPVPSWRPRPAALPAWSVDMEPRSQRELVLINLTAHYHSPPSSFTETVTPRKRILLSPHGVLPRPAGLATPSVTLSPCWPHAQKEEREISFSKRVGGSGPQIAHGSTQEPPRQPCTGRQPARSALCSPGS